MTYISQNSTLRVPTGCGKLTLTAIAAIVMLTTPLPTQAQEIDDIIVTARKRDENLQTVPASVTAITEHALRDHSIQDVNDVARFTPGLSFSQAFGRATERPVIRGAANILAGTQFGVESGTAYFIDGQYYSGDIASLDMNRIARVEIVRGPQSALFGRNSYAGAINFITRTPGDTYAARATAEITDKKYEIYGNVSGPISDNASGSISFRQYDYDGEFANAYDGRIIGNEESFSVDARADFDFGSDISLSLRLGFTDDDDGPRPFALLKSNANNCSPGYRSNLYYGSIALTDTATQAQTDAAAAYNDRTPLITARTARDAAVTARDELGDTATDIERMTAQEAIDTGQIALNAVRDTRKTNLSILQPAIASSNSNSHFQYYCGDIEPAAQATQDLTAAPFIGVQRQLVTLAAIADFAIGGGHDLSLKYALRDEDRRTGLDTQIGGLSFEPDNTFFDPDELDATRDESFEILVTSPQDQAIRWLAGAYYYTYSKDNFDYNLSDTKPGGRFDNRNDIKNQALFAALDFDITEGFTGSAELRYAEETKTLLENGISTEASFDTLAPRFTLNYQINDDVFIFGGIAQGSKSGGLNGVAGEARGYPAYDEEEVTALEFGAKTSALDGRLQANVAVYLNDISDYQLTTSVASPTNPAAASIVTNQGDVEVLGIEFELNILPAENMNFGLTYAYTDAEITEGCDDFQFTLTSGGFLMAAFDPNNRATWNKYRESHDGGTTPAYDPDGRYMEGAGNCSIAGKRAPLTSEHQLSAHYRLDYDVSGDVQGFFNVDMTYESSKFIQVHNLAETGDSITVGAQVGFTTDDWTIRIIGTNLTDDDTLPIATRWFDVLQGESFNGDSAGVDGNSLGPRAFLRSFRKGRSFGLKVSRSF